ncbi:diaminopimelate aminotransferase [candidate division KSB1 bacterium]|nr:MAG: diaminopimelate aminotransferase [candidate division KSB1 bacterium]
MDNTALQKILERIDSYKNETIEIQKGLTAIPALSPENGGTGEKEKSDYIKSLLEKLSFDSIEEIDAPDPRVPAGMRPNLIALKKGKNSDRTIWIMSHMDVVPPGDREKWNTEPYEAVVDRDKIYGRGTEDDQQGFVSSYLAVKAFEEEGITPELNIGLVIVADEESGSKFGIQHVIKERKELFKSDDIIIIPDAGDPEGVTIEVAEKSILWIKCETQGKQTHGSTPEKGKNAHKAAAHFIVKMNELYKVYDKNDPLYDPPISTFEPTKKENKVDNINTIPGSDTVYFDCRILPDYSIDEIKGTVRKWAHEIENEFGVTINLTFPQSESAPPPTSVDAPAVGALKNAIKDLRKVEAKTIGIGGGTVAAYFRRANLPAVCWCTLEDTLHAPNEFCLIKNVLDDAKIFAHIGLQTL